MLPHREESLDKVIRARAHGRRQDAMALPVRVELPHGAARRRLRRDQIVLRQIGKTLRTSA